jgi:hypothetical protein
VISLVLPMAAQNHAHYSRSELRRMMKEASSADQCRTLATWFREEETTFRVKAEAENRQYERYKNMLIQAKFPTRGYTARELRNRYSYKANQMAARASRYETQLSRLDPSYRPVTTNPSAMPGTPITTAPPSLSQNEKMLLDRIERLEQQSGRARAQ